MKKRCTFLVTILILLFTVSACQKNPDAPSVSNKSDGELQRAILSSEAPPENLQSDADWQEQLTSNDNTVNISINAVVEMPEVTELSVVSCTPHYFTLEEVKRAINVFYGDATLYDNSLSDKGWLESEIISRKADLEYMKRNGEYPKIEGDDGERLVINVEDEIAWLENIIAELEADYQAVSAGSSEGVEIKMKANDHGGESVNVRDDQMPPMEFYAVNYKDVNDAAIEYRVTGNEISSGVPLKDSEQLDITITREEAEQKALEVVLACGISECKVISTSEIQVEGQPSYIFTMARLIGGVPSIPILSYEGTLALGTDGKEYREPWRQENIQVVINDKGVVGFRWEFPPEIHNVLNENVAIKSYDEIKEITKNRLQISQTADEFELSQKDGKIIEINRIVLNMMRIAEKDTVDQYYYLPVWDFLGSDINTAAVESEDVVPVTEKSFITINAIDGSIIDRGLGY